MGVGLLRGAATPHGLSGAIEGLSTPARVPGLLARAIRPMPCLRDCDDAAVESIGPYLTFAQPVEVARTCNDEQRLPLGHSDGAAKSTVHFASNESRMA